MSALQQPASSCQVVMCVTSALTCRLSSRLHARRKDSPILSPLIPIGQDGQVCMLKPLAHLSCACQAAATAWGRHMYFSWSKMGSAHHVALQSARAADKTWQPGAWGSLAAV